MLRETEICLATSVSHANDIVSHLRAAWFSVADISMLIPDPPAPQGHPPHEMSPSRGGRQATAIIEPGSELGGALGSLLGCGVLSIPGTVPFVAIGPMAEAFDDVPVGGAPCVEITRVLVGLGLPEFDAEAYQERFNEGAVLLALHARNSEEVTRAKRLLADLGAKEIRTIVALEEEPPTARRTGKKSIIYSLP